MKRAFLDMDGVLVDFIQGMIDVHNLGKTIDELYFDYPGEWDVTKILKMAAPAFWKPINEEFWAKLEWMPDGERLLKIVEDRFGRENVCLLTSPCANYGCYDGKMRWIERHLPKHYKRHLMVGGMKHLCASQNVVLIDDSDANIDKFRDHGGHGILVPRIWNSAHNLRELAAERVALLLRA